MLGIIGGSGIYQLEGLANPRWTPLQSPFGAPSDALLFGELDGQPLVFLPRHGRGHRLGPSEINYRANIDVLKRAGVTELLSVSAVGSLKEPLAPGTFVLVDQFIDFTSARASSFFGPGLVAHVSMAQPVCARLREALEVSAKAAGLGVVQGGTYLAMEGPQFSSLAESKLYRSWGCDVIGMTNLPEAKLSREAELCYASVAMVTDYDCWRDAGAHVTASEVVATLRSNAARARALIKAVAPRLRSRAGACPQGCERALDSAVLTPPEARDPTMVAKLAAIAGRVLGKVGPAAIATDDSADLRRLIRTVPDYPKPGIQFRDITSLLADGAGFGRMVRALAERYRARRIDKVAGIEARGFIIGAAVAHELGVGFVPVRKKGKLPGKTYGQDYALEYGVDRIEVHVDGIARGERVLLVDDLIATGGTAAAALKLLKQLDAIVEEACFVIDLPALGGRKRLEAVGLSTFALCDFEGD